MIQVGSILISQRHGKLLGEEPCMGKLKVIGYTSRSGATFHRLVCLRCNDHMTTDGTADIILLELEPEEDNEDAT